MLSLPSLVRLHNRITTLLIASFFQFYLLCCPARARLDAGELSTIISLFSYRLPLSLQVESEFPLSCLALAGHNVSQNIHIYIFTLLEQFISSLLDYSLNLHCTNRARPALGPMYPFFLLFFLLFFCWYFRLWHLRHLRAISKSAMNYLCTSGCLPASASRWVKQSNRADKNAAQTV